MRWLVLLITVACASSSPAPRPTPPPTKPVATAAWPGVAWDRAEAVTINQVPYGPAIEHLDLRAWDPERGLNPTIVDHKPLDATLANLAVQLVAVTDGGIEVSKCPFPRHAVVFYRGDQPVASINICFACGDILVSPDPHKLAEDDEQGYATRLAAYQTVYPKWQAFFRDQVGFSIIPPPREKP
jgi:hypothetical protein